MPLLPAALLLAVLLAFAGMGLALLIRTLPGVHRAQAYLEGTWTKGKPLDCWTCLVGWSGLLLLGVCLVLQPAWLPPPQDGLLLVLVWFGSTGIGATALGASLPILPASVKPPIIEETGLDEDDLDEQTRALS